MSANESEHDRLHESVGLYVLDALEPNERVAFERHLHTCEECTAEVRALAGVTSALPHAVPLIDPPAGLRPRVMAITGRAATAPSNVVALPPRPARTRPWVSTVGWLSAAALLVLSIGLGGYSMSLQREISGLRAEVGDLNARLTDSEQRVNVATRQVAIAESRMGVLTAPDLAQVDLQGQQPVAPRASGRAFYSPSRGLVFTASDLPPVRAGRAYQLWVVTAQTAVSVGLLELDTAGRVAQAFTALPDRPRPVAIAVTDEPAAGVPAPTGDKYLVGLAH